MIVVLVDNFKAFVVAFWKYEESFAGRKILASNGTFAFNEN